MLKWTYLVKLVFSCSSVQIAHVELLDHMVVLFLIFCGSSICFPRWLHQFTFQPRVHRVPFPPRSCEHLSFLVVLMTAVLPGVQQRRIVVLICISLMISDVEHPYLSICLLPGKMSIQVFCPFSNWDSLGFCHWVVWVLHTLWILTPY